MAFSIVQRVSRKACSEVIKEPDRRSLCVSLLMKILSEGDSAKVEIEKFKELFSVDERRMIRERVEKLLEELGG